jgi:prepilin-type N-terminal cleavage/methylation domain-containing protein
MKVDRKKQKQGGFTLLELLLVVGVGALLLIGGIATYRSVTETNRANDGIRMLLAINSEMQSLYQGQSNYGGAGDDQEAILQGLGVIPNPARHPFNGVMTITTNADPSRYDVTFQDVPSSACVRMLRAVTDPDQVDQVEVDGTVVWDNAALRDSTTNFVGDAVTACGADGSVPIVWTFR